MIKYLGDISLMSDNEKEILTERICNYLIENKLQDSTSIYYNGVVLKWNYDLNKYIVTENVKATDYFEYAVNEHICMTFEGGLYHLINFCEDTEELDRFDMFIESLGLGYELGNSWNMVLYKKG